MHVIIMKNAQDFGHELVQGLLVESKLLYHEGIV
jgi:hypothetical protein